MKAILTVDIKDLAHGKNKIPPLKKGTLIFIVRLADSERIRLKHDYIAQLPVNGFTFQFPILRKEFDIVN